MGAKKVDLMKVESRFWEEAWGWMKRGWFIGTDLQLEGISSSV